MIDRQTLKYKGGRVCPLPPPSAKRLYGGRALKRKTKIAEESANRTGDNLLKEFQSLMRISTCLIFSFGMW